MLRAHRTLCSTQIASVSVPVSGKLSETVVAAKAAVMAVLNEQLQKAGASAEADKGGDREPAGASHTLPRAVGALLPGPTAPASPACSGRLRGGGRGRRRPCRQTEAGEAAEERQGGEVSRDLGRNCRRQNWSALLRLLRPRRAATRRRTRTGRMTIASCRGAPAPGGCSAQARQRQGRRRFGRSP